MILDGDTLQSISSIRNGQKSQGSNAMDMDKGWLTSRQDNLLRISLSLQSEVTDVHWERPLWCKGDWRKGICRPHRCDTQGAGDGSGGALCPTVHVCGKGVIEGGCIPGTREVIWGHLWCYCLHPLLHTTQRSYTMTVSALIVKVATGI